MSRLTWLLIPLLIIAIEGGVLGWRQLWLKPSTAPVFYWKGAELVTSAPPPFGKALELYQADRGAEETASLPDGRKIMIFYFEWDNITMGPFVAAGGHRADVCNVAAGFKLLQSGGHRDYRFTNGQALRFNYTLLADKVGKQVYVYKVPWIQGFGELVSTSEDSRTSRFRRSFMHHCGAARVLQAGIFDAANEDEAWALFQREVLTKVEWAVTCQENM